MTGPRRWKLAASLCGPDNLGPAWIETDIIEGPDLSVDEEVEVIECLPGVIIVDDLGPDIRGEEAPSFSAEPRWKGQPHYFRRVRSWKIGNWSISIEKRNLHA